MWHNFTVTNWELREEGEEGEEAEELREEEEQEEEQLLNPVTTKPNQLHTM